MSPSKPGIGSKFTLLSWTALFIFVVWGQWKHENPQRSEKAKRHCRKQRERDDRRKDHNRGYTVARDRARKAPVVVGSMPTKGARL